MAEDAEKEASEVLHSLLSVERIENKTNILKILNQNVETQWHIPVLGLNSASSTDSSPRAVEETIENCEDDAKWHEKQVEVVDVEATDTSDISIVPNIKKSLKKRKQKSKIKLFDHDGMYCKLETSVEQVKEKFKAGCDCKDNCFTYLQPEIVYRHRLNVAELTKKEHDMYLMGVTMACLADRNQTHRHKERQRQRACYVYQGKRVCLDAFLYLENVTQYHLKSIRTHVMTNGVTPRVHGNFGKKPHNTFSLDMYKCAEDFVKQVISQYTPDITKPFVMTNESRASIYNKFKQSRLHPDEKIMGFSTFRHFMKKQFPSLKFSIKHEHLCSKSVPYKFCSNITKSQKKSPCKKDVQQTDQHSKNTTVEFDLHHEEIFPAFMAYDPGQLQKSDSMTINQMKSELNQQTVDTDRSSEKMLQTAYFITPIAVDASMIQTVAGDSTQMIISADWLDTKQT